MAERNNISSSPACGQWETLLADALDGQLNPGDEAAFTAHMAVCPACAALFEDARLGREWLGFLATEPEVPEGLLDKILARTGPGQVEGLDLATAGGDVLPMTPRSVPVSIPVWQQPGFIAGIRRFAEPRLLMTAAMAFFSISVTISVAHVRIGGLRVADLRPAALRSLMERRLTMASTPIVRYYDHSQFVHEVKSTVRLLRLAAEVEASGEGEKIENGQKPNNSAPGESEQGPGHKDGGSRMRVPQQSDDPVAGPALDDFNDVYENLLTSNSPAFQARPALSGGSARATRERSTVWIA